MKCRHFYNHAKKKKKIESTLISVNELDAK